MDINKAISFIENSFLSLLLQDPEVTDVSYNGDKFFYLHNIYGRKLSDISVTRDEIKAFIRQIANLTDKQFSYQCPILDVTVGKYRLNAVHQSIARIGKEISLTFSLRIASCQPRITDSSSFLTSELISLFETLLYSNVSIVIGGLTGSGKTEFQKYLLRKIPCYKRIILIDNVLELEQVREQTSLDINTWQADERNSLSSIQELVRNALRSSPDWLIVGEARGAEMIEVLNSAMTGHPIITTIHALDVSSMPSRMVRMILMNDKKMSYDDTLQDVLYHFRIYVYLIKEEDLNGEINRRIQSVCYIDEGGKINYLYKWKNAKHVYIKFPQKAAETLNLMSENSLFNKTFLKEFVHE
ncbi:MAG: Flp pilus assembly complex ATPase component TadA [Erysipelotrichaceae bacterium]|jgi:pilus assembly protein CpaF|nr:ATPase, T2SS/T4P/T4SS family [Bacilli bacterium]NLV29013.1 Flp pilus assembly complex ATPase component TadA [Erysipelotrichaceae bacterium]